MQTLNMASQLSIAAVIGFSGKVPAGLATHPTEHTILFPLGHNIVIRHVDDISQQRFLRGHSGQVTCLAISHSGKYVVSGQSSLGKATVIIWDYESGSVLHRLDLHKLSVSCIAISSDEKYVATYGGPDDLTIAVWDLETGAGLCGGPGPSDPIHAMSFFSQSSDSIITVGEYVTRIWDMDVKSRKMRYTDVPQKVRRVCKTVTVSADDKYAYCGTMSGDVMMIGLSPEGARLFKGIGPKTRMSQGVQSSCRLDSGDFVFGGGDGSVVFCHAETLKRYQSTKVDGAVTSIAVDAFCKNKLIIGTSLSQMYDVDTLKCEATLRHTCPCASVSDLAFPDNYASLFVTASDSDIRVWNTNTREELLHIQIHGVSCHCVRVVPSGKLIVSGWSDGKIRAFTPQSGKLVWVIHDAHKNGSVLCLEVSHDNGRIVSGGEDGQVRVWRVGTQSRELVASMKEHRGPVNSICLRGDDSECVSASSDGSCILWDLHNFVRINSLMASSFFTCVRYEPEECQIVTCGTDRKIGYWDATDCTAIRVVEGSISSEVNSLDISTDGRLVVSGGADTLIRLWDYDEGVCIYVGNGGHSEAVTSVKIAPDQSHIVSTDQAGGIVLWQMPEEWTTIRPRSPVVLDEAY